MLVSEKVKFDVALQPVSLASTNATSPYYSLEEYGRVAFVLEAAAMAAAKTVVLQLKEATDGLGTSAADLSGLTCTITANTNVQALTIAASTVIATDALVINGETFTCTTSGAVAADGEFDVGVSDTATMNNLVTAIHAVLPDLYAVNAAGTVTVVPREPGETTVTASTEDTTLTIATTKAIGYIDFSADSLSDGFTHVALKATTNATIIVSALALRGDASYSPVQHVAASDKG